MSGILPASSNLTIKDTEDNIVNLGIGVNINMTQDQCDHVEQPITSLKMETEKDWDKEKVLTLLNKYLLENFYLLQKDGFAGLFQKIQSRMAYVGKTITYDSDDSANKNGIKSTFYTGVLEGINDQGHLMLRVDGELKTFAMGRIVKGSVQ